MAVTLKDIAEQAGVSQMAVSNVLNGKARQTRIGAECAARIEKIANQLNYRPNGLARRMREGRTGQIGILIRNAPDRQFDNLSAFEIILGINQALDEADYHATIVRLADVEQGLANQSAVFREQLIDGMIVVGAVTSDIIAQVRQLIPNYVFADTCIWEPTGCIRRDEQTVGHLLGQQIRQCEYEQVLWVGTERDMDDPLVHYSLGVRYHSLRQSLAGSLIQLHDFDMTTYSQLYTRVDALKPWLTPRTAIIANNTTLASWLAHSACELGKVPGRDFGLASCDSIYELDATWPSLTRVSYDRFGLGLTAARYMLDCLKPDRGAPPSSLLPVSLLAGHTLEPPIRPVD